MIRKLGYVLGFVMLGFTGLYTIVYVYRWEWNRALFVAVLFVAVEVALALAFLLRRFTTLEQRVENAPEREARLVAHLRSTAPERDHFAWLERSISRTNIFVTVLLGAGVLLSGVTWLVDRIATRTATPTLEKGLARRLSGASFPERPLVPSDAELLAQAGPYADDPDLRILLGPEASGR